MQFSTNRNLNHQLQQVIFWVANDMLSEMTVVETLRSHLLDLDGQEALERFDEQLNAVSPVPAEDDGELATLYWRGQSELHAECVGADI